MANALREISITFEEAAFGCTKEVSASRIETCDVCSGTGCKEGTTIAVRHCKGPSPSRRQTDGVRCKQSTADCPKCGGRAKSYISRAQSAAAQGLSKNKKINVTIPAGIDDGQTISLRGQGSAGINGGEPGDLYVTVNVARHPYFTREGTAVLYDMPITIVQAALGDEVEVPTLDGKVKYTIPEGTQSALFPPEGKGIHNLHGGAAGDQYVPSG
jgi:molecular chaperone DnaJ